MGGFVGRSEELRSLERAVADRASAVLPIRGHCAIPSGLRRVTRPSSSSSMTSDGRTCRRFMCSFSFAGRRVPSDSASSARCASRTSRPPTSARSSHPSDARQRRSRSAPSNALTSPSSHGRATSTETRPSMRSRERRPATRCSRWRSSKIGTRGMPSAVDDPVPAPRGVRDVLERHRDRRRGERRRRPRTHPRTGRRHAGLRARPLPRRRARRVAGRTAPREIRSLRARARRSRPDVAREDPPSLRRVSGRRERRRGRGGARGGTPASARLAYEDAAVLSEALVRLGDVEGAKGRSRRPKRPRSSRARRPMPSRLRVPRSQKQCSASTRRASTMRACDVRSMPDWQRRSNR